MRLVPADSWAVLTIWQEARGESHEGRVAVGEVIRNRMRLRYSSDGTVEGTVLRPYQFSGWNTKDPNRIACAALDTSDPTVADCARAWAESAVSTVTRGAVLYYNPDAVAETPAWARGERRLTVIGRHHFFMA